jgi:hypothetical protein
MPPEVVALARKLRRKRPKGGQLSLRAVSRELATQGYLNERGKPYAAKSVASMLRCNRPAIPLWRRDGFTSYAAKAA